MKTNLANLSARPFQRLSVFTFLSINFFQSIPCNSQAYIIASYFLGGELPSFCVENIVHTHLRNHPEPLLADELSGTEGAGVEEGEHVLGHVIQTLLWQ